MFEHETQRELKRIADILEKLYKLAIKEEHDVCDDYNLFIIWKGPDTMSTNNVNLNLTQPFGANQGIPVETNNGQPFVYSPVNIQWQVQDPTIASFVQQADGSAIFTPLAVGSTGVAVQDSSTGANATGTITVTGTANNFAMSIQWEVPIGDAAKKSVLAAK